MRRGSSALSIRRRTAAASRQSCRSTAAANAHTPARTIAWRLIMLAISTDGRKRSRISGSRAYLSCHPIQSVRDRRRREGSERQDIVCFDCGFVMMPGDGMCPSCGRARERRASGTVNVPGEIVAVNLHNRTELRLRWSPHREYVWRQMLAIARKRRPGDGAYAASFARAQYETLFKQWPERSWGFRPEAGEPNLEIQQIVDQQLRSYVRKKIRQGKR